MFRVIINFLLCGFLSACIAQRWNPVGERQPGTSGIVKETPVLSSTPFIPKEKEWVFYFEHDSMRLSEADESLLALHGTYLAQHPKAHVRIEGHTDERGSREYNLALGERRAQAVMRVLLLAGANRSQLSLVSYGELKPSSFGHEESAWHSNRRVILCYES